MHLALYKKTKYKVVTLVLLVLASVLEFTGLSLVLPFIAILFDIGEQSNQFLIRIQGLMQYFGLPISKYSLATYIVLILFFKVGVLILYRYVTQLSVLSYTVTLRKQVFLGLFRCRFDAASDKINRSINAMTLQSESAGSAMQIQLNIAQCVTSLIMLTVLGLSISMSIFFLGIIIAVLIFFSFRITINFARQQAKVLATTNEALYGVITQGLNSYRYLRSVNASDRFFSDLRPLLRTIFRTQIQFGQMNKGTQLMTEPVVLLGLVLVLFLGTGPLDVELISIIVTSVVLTRLFTNVVTLVSLGQGYTRDLVSVLYCENLIDELDQQKDEFGKRTYSGEVGQISMRGVSFGYDGNSLFDNVELDIPNNQLTALSGKSGSGKTTLLNILLGLIPPVSGMVKLDGRDLREYSNQSFRQRVGVVSQDSIVFNLSIRENLRLRNPSVPDDLLIEYLEKFELQSIFPRQQIDLNLQVNEARTNLSGGERQRLALIRELVVEPKLLFLDEATNALDRISLALVLESIEELKNHTTIIVATHQTQVLSIADKIYDIGDGKIKERKIN